jgi:hypothetical protein
MSKKWPNTKHWRRLVETFRTTNGSRWRTAASRKLGYDKSLLRAMIDRIDMHPIEIKKIDATLIDHLHDYAAHLQRRVDNALESAKSVIRATHEVSTYCDIETPVHMSDYDAGVDVAAGPLTPWDLAVARLMEDA